MNNIIVGSAENVTRKLSYLVWRLNPGCLHIYGNEGDMAHGHIMRSIELLVEEVIPAHHEIQLQSYD